jgi:type III secretory pathway lipoprotein EscJ
MSMPGYVMVAESLHESEAQVVVGLLESEGIEALINEDDAGNMIPSLEESRGVQVLVAEKDAKRAIEIIQEFEREDEDDEDDEGE